MEADDLDTVALQADSARPISMRAPGGPNNLFQRLMDVVSIDFGRSVAVIDPYSKVTYAELASLSSAFCDELIGAGIQPRDRVGVIHGNTREFLVAAFGIWKRGAILVPLNKHLQEAELLKYAFESLIRAVVTSSRTGSVVQALQAKGAPIEHTWLCPSEGGRWAYRGPTNRQSREIGDSSRALESEAASEFPAITQYSTGSTGYPKQVTRSHAQLFREFTSVSNVLHVAPNERVLGVAPFFHSHGLMNSAVLALLSGGAVYALDSFFPRDVARLIEREGISMFPGVPFMFQLLADLRERRDFSSLRIVLSAGAPLAEDTGRSFEEAYAVKVRQLYGSTETGVISISGEDSVGRAPNSVGLPVPGVSVRVLDCAGRPVPTGVDGRVEVTSQFAASSYDNATGSSESYFTEDCFIPGDIGRMSPDGQLILSGRYRGFINVGGNKVDPFEVETSLLDLPEVTEAVVFGVPDGAAGEKVKAVLVASTSVSQAIVRAHCVQRLAEFKRPKIIEFRKELPRSPLGKVLRKYLMDESASGQPRYTFDPRSGFRLTHEDTASTDESLGLSRLPPFLRVLLATDGTVTRSIEAYFWEPIEVDVLAHGYMSSDRGYPEIEVEPGDPILKRRVILRGAVTRTAYAFAESVMGGNRVSEEMRRKLIEEKRGIGELLREGRRETFRELFGLRRTEASEWAVHLGVDRAASVLIRNYRIFQEGRATIQIEEVFPESRFESVT